MPLVHLLHQFIQNLFSYFCYFLSIKFILPLYFYLKKFKKMFVGACAFIKVQENHFAFNLQ